jgi:flagellar biosynthetic protein FliQ
MNEVTIVEIAREAMFVTLRIAGPLMAVGTVVGVSVALVQALTTIQEMTLTFVPKIIAILLAIVFFLPMMMTVLIEFAQGLFARIAGG